jgi:hypothetical protein
MREDAGGMPAEMTELMGTLRLRPGHRGSSRPPRLAPTSPRAYPAPAGHTPAPGERMRDAVNVRQTTLAMRALLAVAGVLVIGAGVPLFVLSDTTADHFAWTVQPALTAAALGAAYWGASVLELVAARAKQWAQARVAVPGVLAFTTLMNIPIFKNFENYHLDRPAAWAWIATYLVVPPLMAGVLWHQLKQPGGDPPRRRRLPTPLRGLVGLQGLGMLVFGLALLAVPTEVGALWPWGLDPANSTYGGSEALYFGCWLTGLGIVGVQATWEDDLDRLQGAFGAYLALGSFELIASARYLDTMHEGLRTAAWWAALGVVMLTGVWGLAAGRLQKKAP